MVRVVTFTIGALASLAAGCGAPDGQSLSDRYPAGVRIGYAVEAPYAFVDDRGRVTGESPELARLVAQRLGLSVSFVQTDFGGLLEQLDEGRYDVVAAGVFITPERAKLVRFSVPTFQAPAGALVRRGDPRHLHSLDDILASESTVVVLAGSVEETLVRAGGIPPERMVVVPDAAAARRALHDGSADVVLLSEPTVRWIAMRDSRGAFEAAVFEAPSSGRGAADLGAFAFRQGDHELADAWNRALAGLVGTPEHHALIEPFGFTRRSLPPARSVP